MRHYIWNHADPFRRTAAFLIDTVPMVLAGCVISLAVFGINPMLAKEITASHSSMVAAQGARMVITSGTLVLWILYGAIAETTRWEGTFGKKAMGLRVRDLAGNRPRIMRAFMRNLTKILSLAPGCLGLFWAVFSKESRTWHDLLCGTAVVKR